VGVKERQEREREAVARSILDAATDLFVAEGYHHVSIRKIAERIEYSPGSIYSYFPSKDDIFFALAEEGFRILCTPDPACAGQADPLQAIRGAFWRVYEFSKSHPQYYALMFVEMVIQRAVEEGIFPRDTHPDAVFRILITAIHGAAVGRLSDRSQPGEDSDALARDTLEAALTGLRTGFSRTFHPVPCTQVED
jgi:AcrR family transcriptional regulator